MRIGLSDLDSGWRAIVHGKWPILGIAAAIAAAAVVGQLWLTAEFHVSVPAALFVGVAIFGSAYTYLRSARRSDRLADATVAARLPDAPMLGRIPSMPDKRLATTAGGIVQNPEYTHAIRAVAGKYAADSSRCNSIIVVTSVDAGEGKTTVALNLAAALARGARVLILDGDLRTAALSRLLSLPRYDAGLTELIARTAPFRSALALTGVPNLAAIRTGSLPADPLQILNDARFARTLELSKRHFDYIVIDTPALDQGPDAEVLAAQADSVILVADARAGRFTKIRAAVQKLKRVNARCAGIVFNRVNSRQ